MDEIAALEVGHSRGHLGGHVDERRRRELRTIRLAQVVQQIAVAHVPGGIGVQKEIQ